MLISCAQKYTHTPQCTHTHIKLLSSQTTNDNNTNPTSSPLLPALKRQSKYWIPLLLSWLKGNDISDSDNNDSNPLDSLPAFQTAKQRRQQRQKNAQSSSSNSEVQIEALRALTLLSAWTRGNYNDNVQDVEESNMQDITAGCSPHTPLSTSSIRLLLKHADAVPMIVSLLYSPDPAVHEQAVWILGSISSSGLSASTLPSAPLASAAFAAAAEMTKMMSENKDGVKDGNNSISVPIIPSAAAADNDDDDSDDNIPSSSSRKDKNLTARDVIFAAGTMEPLLKCLADNPNNVSLQRVGAWCLSSLVEGRYSSNDKDTSSSLKKQPLASEELDIATFLPTMKRMLNMDDIEVLTYTCWTLSHLCDGPAYHIAAVIYSETSATKPGRKMSPENGLVPRLVELLLHTSPKVAKPALRTVGNIVCADCADQHDQFGNVLPVVDFTEIILLCQAVPCLRRLIGHPNREIQKEACWTLSNIAAGTTNQIQAVIDSGSIPPLVELVNKGNTDKEVRSEACWVVLNATSCGNDDQITNLIDEGCVSVLGVLLLEPNMIMMALEGIERVLQCEESQDSEDLYNKAANVDVPQRPTIIKCASLIKSVTEGQGNSTAVNKRAKRIWEQHFVSCALCHNNYSRNRVADSHFCNECKCHVCKYCDCRVYHLSYQEELWAEDEKEAEESKGNKKSKKQKKKQKQKAKKAEQKKKLEEESQLEAQKKELAKAQTAGKSSAASSTSSSASEENEPAKKKKANSKAESNVSESTSSEKSGKPSSPSSSKGTTTTGAGTTGSKEGMREDTKSGESQIDLVSYLQQTGSIIALAKLLDSLYENEKLEDDVEGEKPIDMSLPAMTTQ